VTAGRGPPRDRSIEAPREHRLIVSRAPAHTSRVRLLGRRGEELAAAYLERGGYEILARNHRTRQGEIDLIAFDGTTLVFAEVKTRRARPRAGGRGAPSFLLAEPALWAPAARQRGRQRRIALAWLGERRVRPIAHALRFDLLRVLVTQGDELAALEHIEGAW
jgi:putative endonuclease